MTRLLFSLLIVVLLLTGCRQQSPMPQENSIYYWRTEWRLDSVEHDFLKQYDIHKVYCRYFDVVMRDNEPMPNATISFTEPIDPSLSIVPTVYITEETGKIGKNAYHVFTSITTRVPRVYSDKTEIKY